MRRTSLADAKAHLSALVSEAQHKGRKILILRHGKPSAAIVPVDAALAPAPSRKRERKARLTAREVRALLNGFGKGRRGRSAVADLLAGRR